MTSFDVQGIEIGAPTAAVFAYVADPTRLPEWTSAFQSAGNGRAALATPRGAVEIGLEVQASTAAGTVDWIMTFPDGSRGVAFSRVLPLGPDRSVYSFVLTAPPVPLEEVEGALAEQSRTLREELLRLKARLERD